MPIMLLAVVGGVLGLWLFQTGRITGELLMATFYAVAGAALGILLLRLVAETGIAGAVVAAVIGAVVLLWLARRSGRGDR